MEGIQQYQRAVTPTMNNNNNNINNNNNLNNVNNLNNNNNLNNSLNNSITENNQIRGKMLSYSGKKTSNDFRLQQQYQQQQQSQQSQQSNRGTRNSLKSLHSTGQALEISGQSKLVGANRGILLTSRQDFNGMTSKLSNDLELVRENRASLLLPRSDLEPLSEEIPSDGILFARFKNRPESLVVFRLHDERARNPERLNLDRRQLDVCPHLEQEQRLRLLNYQNNNIRMIQNLENLPNLIFLDMYNNKLTSLDGCLSTVKGLRVLMVGKNQISELTNLQNLKKLDVLDLHSNQLREIKGMEGLVDLRVLNLAGNSISLVQNLSNLSSLTELNLRRNCIEHILELDRLPSLQRVFLSHNQISQEKNILCLFNLRTLIELSLDSNPISEKDPAEYRQLIIGKISSLKHLDLKRITEDERTSALQFIRDREIANRPNTSSEYAEYSGNDYNRPISPDQMLSSPDSHINRKLSQKNINYDTNGNISTQGINSSERTTQPVIVDQLLSSHDRNNLNSNNIDNNFNQQLGSDFARSGQNIENIFEVEIIGNNEKALIVVGENWEWTHSKRMLMNVSEVSLRHMRKDVIANKFAGNLSWIPNMKTLTLADNDLKTLFDVSSVLRCFLSNGASIKSLSIIDNPICQLSASILRNYVIAVMSYPSGLSNTPSTTLTIFNEMEITSFDREYACQAMRTLLVVSTRRLKLQQQLIDQFILSLCKSSIDPTINIQNNSNNNNSLSNTTNLINSLQNSLLTDPNTISYDYFRNFSRSGSMSLITDPLASYSITTKIGSSGFPNVISGNKNMLSTTNNGESNLTSSSTSSSLQSLASLSRRTDLEYRYPYKSFALNTNNNERINSNSNVATVPSQNVYAMSLGNNTLLTSPTLVSDMIQVVLNRRKIEQKFYNVLNKYVESVILETVEYVNVKPVLNKNNSMNSMDSTEANKNSSSNNNNNNSNNIGNNNNNNNNNSNSYSNNNNNNNIKSRPGTRR